MLLEGDLVCVVRVRFIRVDRLGAVGIFCGRGGFGLGLGGGSSGGLRRRRTETGLGRGVVGCAGRTARVAGDGGRGLEAGELI